MATKKKTELGMAFDVVQGALAELERTVEVAGDWGGVDGFTGWGDLISLLGPTDAGVMIRSSDRGRARSIGVFVGGQSQWTTCRDVQELLAMLNAMTVTLETIAGRKLAPEPTEKGRKGR